MTVTVVVSPEVGRGMFPQPFGSPHHGGGNLPSITWLVVPEALVCPTCEGECCPYCGGPDADYHTMCFDCTDCHGTGRPDVTIVSVAESGISCTCGYESGIGCRLHNIHGVLVLGEGVPVVEYVFGNEALTADIVQVVIHDDGICLWSGDGDITAITDAIGPQRIEPGMIAYPVTVKS